MSNKKGKLRVREEADFVMRTVDMSQPSYAVVATETPVWRYDETTKQKVQEVLLMSGVEFRGGRDQMPIVDSHNDKTVRNIFGSIQRMRVEGDKLGGQPVWASDPDSKTIATRVAEGHITDFSITAKPLESIFVARGDSFTTPSGNVIEGPALIHTRWEPHNASICATGADVQSTVRRSYTDLNRRVERMDEALLAQLKERGLPDGMTDPNQILAWVVGAMPAPAASDPAASSPVQNAEPSTPPPAPAEDPEKKEPPIVENQETAILRSVQDIQGEVKRALEADKKRQKEIRAACELGRVERSFADTLCDSDISLGDALLKINERVERSSLGTTTGGPDIRVTTSEEDKFRSAVVDGMIKRTNGAASRRIERGAVGHDEFVRRPMDQIANMCLQRMGVRTESLNRKDVVLLAMGNPRVMRQHNLVMRAAAYHTTGSFSSILMDVVNKSLLAEYEEAPYTWNLWARQAASVPDLKTIYRTRISEFPNLEMIPENAPYPEKKMGDSKESYQIFKHGAEFSVSWETIINDDMDALARTTAKMGVAARRTQNARVYEVLTSNPVMGDTYNLFSSSHVSGDNTSGAAAAPSVTTLNAAFLKMRKQTGVTITNADGTTTAGPVLNITPKFLIVPANYEATAMELLGSFARPEVGGSAAGNSQTLNIYGPGGQRKNLTLVAEPLLDASSTTNWYLAADPSQVDTVEITFLQGEESPVIDTEEDFDTDTYKYKVRQTFGAKAIDWRGLYRNSA